VTNGPSEQQRRKIALTGVGRYFDAVVASCDIGAGKPDPAIFHAALAKLGVAASEALMVGNDAERDIAGAAAAGIEAVLVRDGVFAPLARYSRTTQLSRRA
jgi:putative hydrolase of the HAD superfamily